MQKRELQKHLHLLSREDLINELLLSLEVSAPGELREGLMETPARVAKAYETWFGGYGQDPAEVLKVFEDGGEESQEVIVQDIPVWSHCEHHMAPFFGTVSIAYIPNGKIVGLSKLTRLVDIYARRLQVQERLTTQIANALKEHLEPNGVAVVMRCEHTCVSSRGVKSAGQTTLTRHFSGMYNTPEMRVNLFNQLALK